MRYIGEIKTIEQYNHEVDTDVVHEMDHLYTLDMDVVNKKFRLAEDSKLTVDATTVRGLGV